MLRIITILSLFLLLTSCRWGTAQKTEQHKEAEAPVITSLKEAGLPCFDCHSYDRFASEEPDKFSHSKHIAFGVHCNQCHLIIPHNEIALNKDTCNHCHNLKSFSYPDSGMPVIFSHQDHTRKYGCNTCHPDPFQMKKGSTHITMDMMYQGSSCGKCHNGKKAFSVKDCARCHNMAVLKKDFSYPSGDMPAAVFSHRIHTAMFDCGSCHTVIFKYSKGGSGMKMDDIYQNKFCGKCHNGQTAFGSSECQRCHK